MSGGVDSSVAAALLKRAGFDVVGIMLKFWKDGQSSANRCCSIESEKLARLVAKKIGIPFYVINAEKEFKKEVVEYFLREYKNGNTPNPCVVCNKEIKFGFLIKKALALGADFVATGHYAKTSSNYESVRMSEFVNSERIRYSLMRAKSAEKDQSYFLWQLNQEQLKHVLFPVGGYTKPEVRKLAKKFKLPTAETPESQEVCFVVDSTNNFLKKYLKTKSGPVIEQAQNGVKKIIGQHKGLWFYTIGQRKGLGLSQGSAFADRFGETKPWFVVGKDFKKNILIVSKNQKDLFKKELIASDVNWISGKEPKLPIKVKARIRYGAKEADAIVYKLKTNNYKLVFAKPQRAITPGQSVVFYLPVRSSGAKEGAGKELLGGGVIE